mgnify:CR=1 FL=1
MSMKSRIIKLEIRQPREPKINDAYTPEQRAASLEFLAEALDFEGTIEELQEVIKNECGS